MDIYADNDAEIEDQIAASISALLPGGLNLTVGYGDRGYEDDGLEDNDAFYIKPGWRFGNHAVSRIAVKTSRKLRVRLLISIMSF